MSRQDNFPWCVRIKCVDEVLEVDVADWCLAIEGSLISANILRSRIKAHARVRKLKDLLSLRANLAS